MATNPLPIRFSRESYAPSGDENVGIVAAAAVLIALGVRRRSLVGTGLVLAGLPLAYRGLAGRWPPVAAALTNGDTRVALAGDGGVHVRESIRLEMSLAEVYRFWRHFENLPQFMSNLERVIVSDARHSHWIAKGPAGLRVEWDAEIINDIENQLIAWRSLPGSEVVSAGSVNFDAVRGGRSTQVSVNLQYAPPAGRAGALVSRLFGREPSQTIRADLRRLKQLLEAGEIARVVAPSPGGAP